MLESSSISYRNRFHPARIPGRRFYTRWLMTGLLLASLLVDCAGQGRNSLRSCQPWPPNTQRPTMQDSAQLRTQPGPDRCQREVSFARSGYSLFLTKDEVVLNLSDNKPRRKAISPPPRSSTRCA